MRMSAQFLPSMVMRLFCSLGDSRFMYLRQKKPRKKKEEFYVDVVATVLDKTLMSAMHLSK